MLYPIKHNISSQAIGRSIRPEISDPIAVVDFCFQLGVDSYSNGVAESEVVDNVCNLFDYIEYILAGRHSAYCNDIASH